MTFWGGKYRGRNQIRVIRGCGDKSRLVKDMGEIFGMMELFYIVIVVVDNYNLFVQIHRTVW